MNAALLDAEPTVSGTSASSRRPFPWRRLAWGLGAVLGALLAWEMYHVLIGSNVHTLVPGRVYRGAQPSGKDLVALVHRYGIRTVVNLRGCCNTLDWYTEEAKACQQLGLAQEDVAFSAGRLPNAGEIKRLVEILDRAEYPIFLHCRRGSDRTGVIAALILLLQTDATVGQARQAMGLRYGHLNLGRTAFLDRFMNLYERWLAAQERSHTPAALRHWLTKEYEGGWLRYRFEDWKPLQNELKVGQPSAFQATIRNLSDRPWHIKRHTAAGVHVYYRLFTPDEIEYWQARCTLLEATVEPGEALHATIMLPALPRPGRHRVVIDMIEEDHCTFLQAGAEPREEELEVRE